MQQKTEGKTFLCEIGCEELPAKNLSKIATALQNCVAAEIDAAQLKYTNIDVYATPRRLAISIKSLATKQADITKTRKGPRYEAAFAADGAATIACLGFAKSCNVAVEDLETISDGKAKYVSCNIKTNGEQTLNLLEGIMQRALKRLPIAKPMRWGTGDTAFIRPVHWIVMLYGNEAVNAKLFAIQASSETRGHRFHRPEHLHLKHADEYLDTLARSGFVLADFNYRRTQIQQQLKKIIPGREAVYDAALLDEVTALVEWPVAIQGEFAKEFLDLPPEVLITALHSHQKCFPVRANNGKLSSDFIVISNIETNNPDKIIKGNEKVIRARLHDAQFFYKSDLQTPLTDLTQRLNTIIFQESLGSLADKVKRIKTLALTIAAQVQADAASVERAADLCKCDLLTDMVTEFPNLQGVMGAYYAQANGETKEVATAIREHYLPRFANDELPQSAAGACLAIADRLDSIVSIIATGQIPTGDKDPFALRRAAAGIIRIVFNFKWQFDIYALCQAALDALPTALANDTTLLQAATFIRERLRSWCLDAGFSAEEYNAIIQKNIWECLDFQARIYALKQFCKLEAAKSLAGAHKRVSNILRKNPSPEKSPISREQLHDPYAIALYDALQNTGATDLDYSAVLNSLASLSTPIDDFFENVMVICDDLDMRKNRLALLQMLQQRLAEVADISCLSI